MLYDPAAKARALALIERCGPAPTHYRMAELAGRDKYVLELGCATGYVSELLKINGCRVLGIELDPDAADRARAHCERVIVGDLADPEVLLGAGDGFDVVLCGDILEHLPAPDRLLMELKPLLKPGGFILASIPNIAFWRMRLDLLMGRWEYQDFGLLDRTHLRFFTVRTFVALIEECGFRVDHMVVNDSGFPFSRLIRKIPGLTTPVDGLAGRLARWFPNLFAFHSIYKLVPVDCGIKQNEF